MLLYASTVFLSAFLLFQIQPVITKLIQPWFGGAASVWTTGLVFFQAFLLLGYLYAHWINTRLRPATQSVLHAALLGASLLFLPVTPGAGWRPAGGEDPAWRILGLLTVTVGLPYFLLSTTAPLVQSWYARSGRHLPYRLYAVANLAAVVGLVAYPFAVEPFLATEVQARAWSGLYAAFCILCIGVAVLATKESPSPREVPDGSGPTPLRTLLLWLILAFLPSMLLVAVTNYLTQSIASIPFLWILPLAVYLVSFMICFGNEELAPRGVFVRLLAVALIAMAYFLWQPRLAEHVRVTVVVFSAGLFVCCLFGLGELVRHKPHPRHLTRFYLMVAVGGALGGFTVSIVAPLVFPGYFELPLALAAFGALALGLTFRRSWRTDVLWITVCLFLAATVFVHARSFLKGSLAAERSFYGTVRVIDFPSLRENETVRVMVHGGTDHGRQFLSPDLRRQPTSYYGLRSGIGLLLSHRGPAPLRVGVIGLGAGCLAAYGQKGDCYRFYEVNPMVVRLANDYFHFLSDTPAKVDVVVGDGRLSLAKENPQAFDILVVDAFSGGSIPVHMLVREAFEQYFRHLKPAGVLALHITNTWLDLAPVVAEAARAFGASGIVIHHLGAPELEVSHSTWALVTRNGALFDEPHLKAAGVPLAPRPGVRMWTDDYSNLVQIMK
ncbi:MAG: fused MFS/spermidine synthase [Bryobacteraceae bacterium]|nr:fused MFS/spermidine synthase [Bryobacteraceae bacterium]